MLICHRSGKDNGAADYLSRYAFSVLPAEDRIRTLEDVKYYLANACGPVSVRIDAAFKRFGSNLKGGECFLEMHTLLLVPSESLTRE
jgi:hypothetical protein